jgi:hypothetical protein
MAILAVMCGTLLLASALSGWRRPTVFWPSVVGLAGCTLAVLVIAGQRPVSDFVVVSAFVLLGPIAIVLSLLRVLVLTRNLFLIVVTGVVAFVCATALWVIVAINVGALAP